jgi:Family of unknown function (DUF6311)
VLDPTEIDWLMKGDWVPHYFGWHYFRVEPWHWPPGVIEGYHAPLGTSVGLTDSIPLLAYALKPIAAWLPMPFQYLGLWLLACFTLQGALASWLVGRATPSPWAQLAGGVLAVSLPTLLVRVGHAALCAHWLVLWALLIATSCATTRFAWWAWATLGLVAGLVQPYLAAMVWAVLAATTVSPWPRPESWRARGLALAAATVAMLAGWWLSGLFVLAGERSLAEGGLGYFSMNLLSFVAPGGWSAVLPEIPLASPGQAFEGFHYLGLGVLLLVVTAVVVRVRRRVREDRDQRVWPLPVVAATVVMTLVALSPTLTLGTRTVVDLNGPWSAPLALFRSSGRFVWPLTYLLLAWAVATVARRLPPRTAAIVLAAAVAVQAVDLHGAHRQRAQTARDPAFHAWPRLFASARWAAIAPAYRHVVLVPPPQCGEPPLPYEPALGLAATHGLTLNAGVVARSDTAARARYCAEADREIDAAALRDDTIYLVKPDAARVLRTAAPDRLVCGRIDTIWLCTTAAAHGRWAARANFD